MFARFLRVAGFVLVLIALAIAFDLAHVTVLLALQDSTGTVPPPPDTSVLTIPELLQWGASLLGAYLFHRWNVAQGKLDGINNFVKALAATALVAAVGFVAHVGGAVATGTGADLTAAGLTSIIAGIGTTLLVRLGITTAKQKARVPSKDARGPNGF